MLVQGEQGDADVAELAEEPVQGGLVGDWSSKDGGAVLQQGQGHAVEAVRPVGAEMSLEADLVPGVVGPGWGWLVRHGSLGLLEACARWALAAVDWFGTPQARSGCGEQPSPHLVKPHVEPDERAAVTNAAKPGVSARYRCFDLRFSLRHLVLAAAAA